MGNPALDEMRSIFAQRLTQQLPDVDVQRLYDAVTACTQDWTAKRSASHFRDANGVVQDGADLVTGVHKPITELVRLTVAWQHTRNKTAEESTEERERVDAMLWRPQDGPPPRRVPITRLLEQRTWWRPRDADPIRLVDMEPSHRHHLLGFLRRNAARYKSAAEWNMFGMMSGPMGPSGDMATDAVEGIMDELIDQRPEVWIDQQPLAKRLCKLIKRDEKMAARP
jgi:hypothetical protein